MPPSSSFEFINREISWLGFNARVLQEAADPSVPLIERMRFLGIFSNNLDEFFRVRVASLKRMQQLRVEELPVMEKNPAETLEVIHKIIRKQQKLFEETYRDIIDALSKEGVEIVNHEQLSSGQRDFARDYFYDKVRPRLVPIMLGGKAQFPELKDSQIYFAIRLVFNDGHEEYAVMEIPADLPRFIILPEHKGKKSLIFLDDIIRLRLKRVFSIFSLDTVEAFTIKTSRDAELDLDDDIQRSIIDKLSSSVKKRKQGEYVRFLYDSELPEEMLQYFMQQMDIKSLDNLIPGGRYHSKRDLMGFPDFGLSHLIFPSRPPLPNPSLTKSGSVLQNIDDDGILLHTPYQDFSYIVDLLREAAIDPKVTKIRITLYRVAKDSRIVNALINAARNGKRVIVVIELQARFDEVNNIHWSNRLKDAGAKLIFGVPGLKVHSKLICITRKKKKKTTRIACIGTGNFHEGNARVYTDIFLLTKQSALTKEVKRTFDFFETNYDRGIFRHLLISPFNTRRRFHRLIQFEIDQAKAGKPAWIEIKLNNLVDETMIALLYKASKAGVKIKMVIRGICSLVPGVKGLSENISVVSIVGRYLEHSRIAIFYHGGESQYYISSADWMTRNLDHRVEVSCPIYNPVHQEELKRMMDFFLQDNVKARIVEQEMKNNYVHPGKNDKKVKAQEALYEYFQDKIV